MSSADKVTLVDTMNGANLCTLTASGTKIVVYGCEIVNHGDSTVRTALLALAASDTAVGTYLAHLGALLVVRALYYYTGGVLYHLDDAVRTCARAHSASDTLDRVDLGNTALVNADSLGGAHTHTVAVAKAGEGTAAVAGEAHISRTAGCRTVVIVLSLFLGAVAVTSNVSNHLNNVLSLNAEDCCDLASGRVAAGDTKVGLVGISVTERLSVAVTARVATGTAVCTGEALTHGCDLFVFLYAEEHGCERKKHRTKHAGGKKNEDRYQNSHNVSPFLMPTGFRSRR